MKNYGFILAFFFYTGLSKAQVTDDFTDGDFEANPAWMGSASQFIVNAAGQLQLNAVGAGASYLSTSFASPIENVEWQMYVKEGFSPSGNNYGRVYLVSDHSDLTLPLNGYYLQFGEAGSNDAVELFRQTGSILTSVCRARPGAIASSFAIRVKVLRDSSGLWKIFIDYAGGTGFVEAASGTDLTYTSSSFLGMLCVFTASNATKFYFDDFYAGPQQLDTTPPELQSIQINSSSEISLTFSEVVDAASAELISHYSADNNLGNPQACAVQSNGKTVNLTFGKDFVVGIKYSLAVSGVKDPSGNTIVPVRQFFLFFQSIPAQPKDIVISEIFPDPSPQIGLPDSEFIEIHNRSSSPFDLDGWKFSDGISVAIIPSCIILPRQYWILTSSSASFQFTGFGNVQGVSNFPTLNNEGEALTLKRSDGLTIDSVNYTIAWYRDADKQEGGWTLELIDPANVCGEEENWAVSEDPRGGTPGKENSVFQNKPDLTGPKLRSVVPVQANQLLLTFDEKLHKSTPVAGSFELTPFVPISKSYFTDLSLRQIQFDLGMDLQRRQRYTLKVQAVRDCIGNLIQDEFSELKFALPEPADSLDVIVNEILFNPRPNGVDFVEVYNRSPKYLSLKDWALANVENNTLKNIRRITSADLTLSPESYLVLTPDPAILKDSYPQSPERDFFPMDLPSLPDDEGSLALVNDKGEVVDYFLYDKNLHSEFVKDDEGISLERVSFSSPTNDRQNWKSASAQSGFATPGYVNSNARPENPVAIGNVTIEPEIFAPNTGVQDFAKIIYAFEESGYVANIKIVDQQGHPIKSIANNETLGFEGFFRWDGERDDGSKARTGYYLIWIEVFDVSGVVRTFRRRVIVASR